MIRKTWAHKKDEKRLVQTERFISTVNNASGKQTKPFLHILLI